MNPVRGMICPVVTPFTADYEVDVPALRRLCAAQMDSGIDVLFVLGTTGEFYALSPAQRRCVVDTALETAAGRVPVIAGISGDSTSSCVASLSDCRGASLAGYVASTPYFLSYSQDELFDHFRLLADAADGRPLILYNYPDRYRHVIAINTVAKLLRHGRVTGIKDTAGDFEYFRELQGLKQSFPDFAVFEGALPNLPRSARLGIDGSVQAIANLMPDACARVWRNIQACNWNAVEREVGRLWAFHQQIETVAPFIAAVKACMALRGWCGPTPAQPNRAVGAPGWERLSRMLDGLETGLAQRSAPSSG